MTGWLVGIFFGFRSFTVELTDDDSHARRHIGNRGHRE